MTTHNPSTDMQTTVQTFCRKHRLIEPDNTVVAAVSGGADSLCLLYLLREWAPVLPFRLHVAHLNHGLRGPAADADADFVAQLAQAWGLSATIGQRDVARLAAENKFGLEEAARHARYSFLAEVAHLTGAAKIAVGHHANDQAETVLMRFLRGSGVTGLRGMLPATPLPDYRPQHPTPEDAVPLLIRPLLAVPKTDIEAYCREHGLSPRQDASNTDPIFLRNKVRREILPLLKTVNPNIVQSLQNTAQLMAADHEVLQKEADRAWKFVTKSQTPQAIRFDRHDWRVLPVSTQRKILRRAIAELAGTPFNIDFTHIQQSRALIETGTTGKQRPLPHGLSLELTYKSIIVAHADYTPPPPNRPRLSNASPVRLKIPGITLIPGSRWYIHTNLHLPDSLSPAELTRPHPWLAYFDAAVAGNSPSLRPRRPGDVFYPFGLQGHTQRLKDFFINQKIPAPQRPHIPLLISTEGAICWVCGWRIDHRARVTATTGRILSVQFKQKPVQST